MKIRNIIATIILSICIAVMPIANVSAYDYVGLITKCSLSCTYSDGTLKIYAKTQASGNMDEIGFVNIIIQKSSDCQNWTDEKNIGNFIKSDKKYYTLEHSEKISGGFYYRILCTHYASGKPFGSNDTEFQTAENTSKSVWAEALPVVTFVADATTTKSTTKSTTKPTASTTTAYTQEEINFVQASSDTVKTSKSMTAQTSRAYMTSQNTSTTVSIEKTVISENAKTGVNFPLSALSATVLATVIAVISRKKSK